jgi:hypothetical protein
MIKPYSYHSEKEKTPLWSEFKPLQTINYQII